MRRILLYRNGKPIMGSTGFMRVDGRLTRENVIKAVKERNKTVEKNFPNEVCDSFFPCDERLRVVGNRINL